MARVAAGQKAIGQVGSAIGGGKHERGGGRVELIRARSVDARIAAFDAQMSRDGSGIEARPHERAELMLAVDEVGVVMVEQKRDAMHISANGRMHEGRESFVVGRVRLAGHREQGDHFVVSALGGEHESGGACVLAARVMGVCA